MDVDSFENESRKSLFKNKKIPMYMWKQPRTRNVKEVAPVTDMGQDYHKNSCSDTHTRFKADFFLGFFRGGGTQPKMKKRNCTDRIRSLFKFSHLAIYRSLHENQPHTLSVDGAQLTTAISQNTLICFQNKSDPNYFIHILQSESAETLHIY